MTDPKERCRLNMFAAIRLIAALLAVGESNADGGAQKKIQIVARLHSTPENCSRLVRVEQAATLRAVFSPQAQLRVKKNIRCLRTTHGGDKYPAGYPRDTAALFWLFLPAIKMINCAFSFSSASCCSRRGRERKKGGKKKLLRNGA